MASITIRTGRVAAAILIIATAPCFAGTVDVANVLRAQGCGKHAPIAQLLRRNESLDRTAALVAEGEELLPAAAASGYRARTSAVIQVSASGNDLAQLLEGSFCEIIADPDWQDLGIFSDNNVTWLVFAAPFPLDAGSDARASLTRLVELANEARARPRRCGRARYDPAPPLTTNSALDRAAEVHALDVSRRGVLSHEGSDGSVPGDRATRAGYRWRAIAENVAAGQTTAEQLVETWLQSPGHCANLMDARYSQTGVAIAINKDDDYVIYWVQVYAAPQGSAR